MQKIDPENVFEIQKRKPFKAIVEHIYSNEKGYKWQKKGKSNVFGVLSGHSTHYIILMFLL